MSPARGLTPIPGDLVFSDAMHGWLLLHDGAAAGSAPHSILRTVDAGRHWTRVEFNYLGRHSPMSLPGCDGAAGYLSFMNATTGWAMGICGAGPQFEEVFGTHDGGHTWHQSAIPTPGTNLSWFDPGTVVVVGMHRFLLLPVSLAKPRQFVLYRSIDGGLSWKPTTPIPGGSPNASMGPDFSYGPLTNLISWVLIGHTVYRTTDGGVEWYPMTSTFGFGSQIQLDFVTKHDGFAVNSGAQHILVTTDSGRHWQMR